MTTDDDARRSVVAFIVTVLCVCLSLYLFVLGAGIWVFGLVKRVGL